MRKTKLAAVKSTSGGWWGHLSTLVLPIILGVLTFVALALPPQLHEIYRAIAQGLDDGFLVYRELTFAVLAIIALALVSWLTARQAMLLYSENDPCGQKGIALYIPQLLACIAPIAVAIGLGLATVDAASDLALRSLFYDQFLLDGSNESNSTRLAETELTKFSRARHLLWLFAGALVGLAGLVFLIVRRLDRSPKVGEFLRPKEFHTTVMTRSFLALVAIVVVTFIVSPVVVPQQVGFVGLLGLFLAFLLLAVSQLYAWGRRLGAPLIAIVLLYAIGISAFDLNDNHKIRTVQYEGFFERIELPDAFQKWWATREDRAKFQGKERYPVYVVAAQGGGIYAAHHVASFLAGIQDQCPSFAHHLFAISGVSGGSVGATAFAGLTRELTNLKTPDLRTCYPGTNRPSYLADTIEEIFGRDLLSPLAASLFFPDFIQDFIPIPFDRLDRARALEMAFEDAYSQALKESGFDRKLVKPPRGLATPFQSHWDPGRYPDTPALVLNTTDVESGARRIISPFRFTGVGLSFFPIWSGRPSNYQPVTLPLSTAAFLSARFPWVTPAGWFEDFPENQDSDGLSPKKLRLVDGGFFENSGVATAADILEEVIVSSRRGGMADEIELVLIVFSSAGFVETRRYGLAEILEPVRAMLNTRAARSKIEFARAANRLRSFLPSQDATVSRLGCPASISNGVNISAMLVKLELRGNGYDLPLGWRLSPLTRHLISVANGRSAQCSDQDKSAVCDGDGVSANCVRHLIFEKLN